MMRKHSRRGAVEAMPHVNWADRVDVLRDLKHVLRVAAARAADAQVLAGTLPPTVASASAVVARVGPVVMLLERVALEVTKDLETAERELKALRAPDDEIPF